MGRIKMVEVGSQEFWDQFTGVAVNANNGRAYGAIQKAIAEALQLYIDVHTGASKLVKVKKD